MKTQLFRVSTFVVLFLLTSVTAHATVQPYGDATVARSRISSVASNDNWGKMPLYFIANEGQMDSRVAFYVQGNDKTLYFTPDGVTFALTSGVDTTPNEQWNVKLDFIDANVVQPIGQAQTDAIISYFKGPPDEWHTGLPTFSKIVYNDLWQGIDLVYGGTVNRLKYEFIVQPGADPAQIRLAYRGATVRLNDLGQLEVSTPLGGFNDDSPVAYQDVNGQRVPVAVGYALDDTALVRDDDARSYGFRLGDYNPNLPLVIDPVVLIYCGYIGGSSMDSGNGIAVDSAGNAYVVGATWTSDGSFPVTVGPYLIFRGGLDDAFVAKVKADGTGLIYAGFIGGSGYDEGYAIAVDGSGNAYVAGYTASDQSTFPVLIGPRLTYSGSMDAFVAKVRADGTGLVYCGYIGGSGEEIGEGIAVDSAGNAYVTGYTKSSQTTFPITVGPDLTFNGGGQDAFVAKVKADGTGFVYAGYIGGDGIDEGKAIAVDSAGSAYVTGRTESNEGTFPVTVGPNLTFTGPEGDAFVAKVKSDGTGLVYAGYIGGSGDDRGYGIAVDTSDNAYVTGFTTSDQTTFPVTIGPDLTYNGGGQDAFVAKVRADGTGLIYAGYIGGDDGDSAGGIAIDTTGAAYVTGGTKSTESTFPVKEGPGLTYRGGLWDGYVAKVKVDGTGLDYCGYIGGSEMDYGVGIAVDAAGNAYVTGLVQSDQTTFPVTVGPDLTHNGWYDAFVAMVTTSIVILPATLPSGTPSVYYSQTLYALGGTAPYTYTLTGTLPSGITFNNGLLSGTTTLTGSYPITVGATDMLSKTGSRDYVLIISRKVYLPLIRR